MKKRLIIPVLLFVIVAACAASASADDSVLLRYKYTKGDVFVYHLTADVSGTVESLAGETEPGKGVTMPVKVGTEMAMTMNVADVGKDGVATVISTFDSVRMTQSGNVIMDIKKGDPVDDANPLAAILGAKITTVSDSKGKVLRMEGLESLSGVNSSFDISSIINQSSQPFPDNPVKPGDSWKAAMPSLMGMEAKGEEVTYTYAGSETVKGLKCAKITSVYSGDVSALVKGFLGEAGNGVTVDSMAVSLTGDMYINIDTGVVVAAQTRTGIKSKIRALNPETSQTTTIITDMVVDGVFEIK